MKSKVALASVGILLCCVPSVLAGDALPIAGSNVLELLKKDRAAYEDACSHLKVPTAAEMFQLTQTVPRKEGHNIQFSWVSQDEQSTPLNIIGYDGHLLGFSKPGLWQPTEEEDRLAKERDNLRDSVAMHNRSQEGKDVQIDVIAPEKLKRGKGIALTIQIAAVNPEKLAGKVVHITVDRDVVGAPIAIEDQLNIQLPTEPKPQNPIIVRYLYTPTKPGDYLFGFRIRDSNGRFLGNYYHGIVIISGE